MGKAAVLSTINDIFNLNMESLIELNNQCHEHLRESNRKKDAMLGFYLSATFIMFGLIGNSSNLFKTSIIMWVCFAAVAIAGICLGAILTMYRGWHGLYIITSVVLQELITKGEQKISNKFIRDIDFKFCSLFSVEFLLFLFSQIFVGLNLYVMFYILPLIVEKSTNIFYSKELCNTVSWGLFWLFIFEFSLHIVAMIILDNFKKKGKLNEKYLWLLNGKIENK